MTANLDSSVWASLRAQDQFKRAILPYATGKTHPDFMGGTSGRPDQRKPS